MKTLLKTSRGFTLLELLVSFAIFSIVSVIIYSTFSTITSTVSRVTEANKLSDKAQRILTFMEEDIRMAGHLLGDDARVPYCTAGVTPASPNVFAHVSGNPYDSLTFLTTIPIMLDETAACMNAQTGCPASGDPTSAGGAGAPRIDYYLTTRCDSNYPDPLNPPPAMIRPNEVYVDTTGGGCYSDTGSDDTHQIHVSTTANQNGKSLVTFEGVTVGNGLTYYELDSVGYVLTLKSNLDQRIPDNSTVYGVRQYRYSVDTVAGARTLQRIAWKYTCALDPTSLLESSNTEGGVDGLKFEFTSKDESTKSLVVSSELPNPLKNLKYVTVWLLVRSDRKSSGYTNKETYTLGSSAGKITLGPYNDSYRRVLVHKTVEVINFVSKTT